MEDNGKHNDLVNDMLGFFDDGKPKVGIFWYNPFDNILFGVMKDDAEKYERAGGWGTLPKLHKTYWQKQHHRAVTKGMTDSVFYKEQNYTLIPRGRVFVEDGRFFVAVGDWIEGTVKGLEMIDKDKVRELIEDEFNIPDFEFYRDYHWDIGHGWSEELGIQRQNPRAKAEPSETPSGHSTGIKRHR